MPAVSLSPCPDASVLKQYVSGALDESAAAEFGRHLEHCSRCQHSVDQQLAAQSAGSRSRLSDRRRLLDIFGINHFSGYMFDDRLE